MITLAMVAISLTIGLIMQFAYGQPTENGQEIYDTNYCQKNLTATAQRLCGKLDAMCKLDIGENKIEKDFFHQGFTMRTV